LYMVPLHLVGHRVPLAYLQMNWKLQDPIMPQYKRSFGSTLHKDAIH
jgi:hypothetical protein